MSDVGVALDHVLAAVRCVYVADRIKTGHRSNLLVSLIRWLGILGQNRERLTIDEAKQGHERRGHVRPVGGFVNNPASAVAFAYGSRKNLYLVRPVGKKRDVPGGISRHRRRFNEVDSELPLVTKVIKFHTSQGLDDYKRFSHVVVG